MLARYYRIGSLAVIGGDRNCIEPAVQGVPTLIHARDEVHGNLAAIDFMVSSGAAKKVADADEIFEALKSIGQDESRKMGDLGPESANMFCMQQVKRECNDVRRLFYIKYLAKSTD